MESVNDIGRARSQRIAQHWNANERLTEIIEVLLDLGGAAHRDVVLNEIGWRHARGPVSHGLRSEVMAIFDEHCAGAAQAGVAAVVRPAFGPDSRRWEITPDVRAFLAEAEADARRASLASPRKAAGKPVRMPVPSARSKVTKGKFSAAAG